MVCGPERSGYLLGPLVAHHLAVGFVGVSKEPRPLADSDIWLTATTPPDYRDRHLTMSMRQGLIGSSDRVLVVDDWADTGGQATAIRDLIRQTGAHYVGAAVVVDGLASHEIRRGLDLRGLLHLRDLRHEKR